MPVTWPQRLVFSSSGGNKNGPRSCFSSLPTLGGGGATLVGGWGHRLKECGRNLPPEGWGVTIQSLGSKSAGRGPGPCGSLTSEGLPAPAGDHGQGEALPDSHHPLFMSSCCDSNTNLVA